jgi:hypothetical protein
MLLFSTLLPVISHPCCPCSPEPRRSFAMKPQLTCLLVFLLTAFTLPAFGQQTITTFAGGGPADNSLATSAALGCTCFVTSAGGNVYVSSAIRHRVFRVDGSATSPRLQDSIFQISRGRWTRDPSRTCDPGRCGPGQQGQPLRCRRLGRPRAQD